MVSIKKKGFLKYKLYYTYNRIDTLKIDTLKIHLKRQLKDNFKLRHLKRQLKDNFKLKDYRPYTWTQQLPSHIDVCDGQWLLVRLSTSRLGAQ